MVMSLSTLQGVITVFVKPNARTTEIVSYDEQEKILKINIKSKPQDNKANEELIKFLSKTLKKKVVIKSGLTSRTKRIELF